jgi:hypothetical protein
MLKADIRRGSHAQGNLGGKGDSCFDLNVLRDMEGGPLSIAGVPGLVRVILRSAITVWPNLSHDAVTFDSEDLLSTQHSDAEALFSPHGQIARATFDFYFADSQSPRSVTITPPGTLQTERPADSDVVLQWARALRFLSEVPRPPPESSVSHEEQSMVVA